MKSIIEKCMDSLLGDMHEQSKARLVALYRNGWYRYVRYI